ncbi:MAG: LCP family protein [Thermomicrobiales bacterium]|nr:LCP family protein [Thermomicrobiales bacterium]
MLCAVALAVAVGFAAQVDRTATAIRRVSTPPPVVSGAAFDRGDDLWIDTGPARAAVQTAEAARAAHGENGFTTAPGEARVAGRMAATPAARAGVAVRGRLDWAEPGWRLDRAIDAEAAPAASPAGEAAMDRPLTILLMGVDARAGEEIDIGVRPDALALLRLDPADGSCRLLAIPRDTRTELPGYGLSKINHALAVGGVPYERLVVENLLGLEIDRFVLVDFQAVVETVDALGGVTVDVPDAFTALDGTSFAAGTQTLDGRHALSYSQYRGFSDGDLGRIHRQQQVLRALLVQASGLEVVPAATRVLPLLEDHLRTDLSPGEMVSLARRYRATCTAETLQVATLDGEVATFDDPLVQAPLSYLVVDPAEIDRKRAQLLGLDAD